ncbi:MAG: ABC transporter ATP-binding protein [Cyanobacteria bacterium P01_D01_bin.105]
MASPNSKTAVLSCQNITKRFEKGAAPAVNQVSLALNKGDLLGLLGPSGCGKTTLLRLIAGFEIPESGDIELAETSVCSSKAFVPPERRQVGVVFQDYALFPHLNVFENVTFGLKQLCRRGQLPKKQIKILAQESLNLVGLSDMGKRYPHELSGGQQQRVALARALAPKPPLVLLDEPFSNLDVQVRLRLRQEVRDILKNVGASGIFVTHDQEEALAISDRVAVMQNGYLVQADRPEDIYQHPATRFIAEFVTQANFITATHQQQGWVTELGPLNRSLCNDDVNCADGDLMVLQEDLRLRADENGSLIVKGRQFLGREYQYALLSPSQQVFQARTAASQRFEMGDRVSADIVGDRIRFFPNQGQPTTMEVMP